MHSSPAIIISVDSSGHVNQCLALCEELNWPVGTTIKIIGSSRTDSLWSKIIKRVKRVMATSKFSPAVKSFDQLRVVASGASSEALVAVYRKLYGDDLFAMFVGAPKWKKPIYDLAIASNHAKTRDQTSFVSAGKTIWMSGVFTRGFKTGNRIRKESVQTVLIGGANKAFRLDAERLGSQIEAICGSSKLPVAVVFSPRTPLELEQTLRVRLQKQHVRMIDRVDRAGFEDVMSAASSYFVTPDSISMICEACATNLPVVIFDLECFDPDTSTARFVAEFIRDRRIRKFGDGSEFQKVQPLDGVNAKIVEVVAAQYNEWHQEKLTASNRNSTSTMRSKALQG